MQPLDLIIFAHFLPKGSHRYETLGEIDAFPFKSFNEFLLKILVLGPNGLLLLSKTKIICGFVCFFDLKGN